MKKLFLLLCIPLLLSCGDTRVEKRLEMTLEVKYRDNLVDTLDVEYVAMAPKKAKFYVRLDKGCLEYGFESFTMRTKNNAAYDVRSYEKLYGVMNGKDTLR